MKRRFLQVLVVLCCCFTVFGICACESSQQNSTSNHQHDYSSEWGNNETHHWLECSCGDKKGEAEHILGNEATETTDQVCVVCGYVIVPALGHSHANHLTKIESTESSCAKEGNVEYYVCSCGIMFTDATATQQITDESSVLIAKKEHSFSCKKAEQDYLKSEATCTSKALYYYSCVCGECGEETFEYGSELGHAYGEWEESIAATCTSGGVEIRICENDSTHIETRMTEKIKHSYVESVTLPTCTTKGYTTYTCSCGESYTDNYIDETGIHNYVENVCIDCGKQKTSEGLAYSINSDGLTCRITGIGDCVDTELFIPSKIDDYIVATISSSAFNNCVNLTSVTVPDSVTSINSGAFKGCTSLKEITVPFVGKSKSASGAEAVFGYIFGYTIKSSYEPESGAVYQYEWLDGTQRKYNYYYIPSSLLNVTVTGGDISDNAFRNCEGLTNITIPDRVTSIGSSAFHNCTSLTSVTIGENVTSIGDSAFYGCSGLTSITIPDSVTEIGDIAFGDCGELTSVTIGSGVTSIAGSAFLKCYKITNITLNSENEAYYVVNNCLIEKTTKTLMFGCNNSVIPDDRSIVAIGAYAFAGRAGITNISIPYGVTSIGGNAFEYCTSLKEVVMANSVTVIGSSAFSSCISLENITLSNNLASIGSSAFSSCTSLESITIPSAVTYIGSYAFHNCSGLKSIVFKYRYNWYSKSTSEYSGQVFTSDRHEMSADGSKNVYYFVNRSLLSWFRK